MIFICCDVCCISDLCLLCWQLAFSPLEGTKMTVNNLHPRVTEEDIVVSIAYCVKSLYGECSEERYDMTLLYLYKLRVSCFGSGVGWVFH